MSADTVVGGAVDEPIDVPVIRRGLAGLRRKARAAIVLRGVATAALLLVLLGLVSFGLDRTLRLSWDARAVILVLSLTAIGAVTWTRLVAPLGFPLPDVELARVVERLHPELDWRLLSAVEFADPGWQPGPETSRELAALVVAEAEQKAAGIAFGEAVPSWPMAGSFLRANVVLAAGLLLVVAFPQAASTWAQRCVFLSSSVEWPQDTHLEVVGFSGEAPSVTVPRGDDLTLVVQARGVVPSRVYVDTVGEGEDPREETFAMDALGEGRFRLVLEQVTESFSFTARGGDERGVGPYRVRVIRRPWIEDLTFHVEPPAYTGLEPREFGLEAGSVQLPLATRVVVTARASKPLRAARLEEQSLGGSEAAAVHTGALAGEREFEAAFDLERTGVFEVVVEDEDGLGFEQPTRFSLVAEPDEAPQVELRLLGVGLNVTPEATVRYVVTAEDDYGMNGGALRYRGSGGGEEAEELEAEVVLTEVAGRRRREVRGAVELAELELTPKMAFTVWAEAVDADPRGPNTGASPSHQLRIVTAERLLNELLRRLHEQRIELERMITEEEKLAQGLAGADETVLERAPRTHRDVGRTVLRAAEVVEGVVAEMIANKLLDKSTYDRLGDGVAGPLRDLGAGPLQRARLLAEQAQEAEAAARAASMSQAGEAARVVVVELRQIVARMGRIEDLAELVAMLKRIIDKQKDVVDRARQEMEDD